MDTDLFYHLTVGFITTMLGTQPANPPAQTYLADKLAKEREKHPEKFPPPANDDNGLPADELDTMPKSLEESLEKITTAFHKKDGEVIIYDYVFKGFLKESGGVLNGAHNVKALRSKVESLVFPYPRQIRMHYKGELGIVERPLRAKTAQGPRTTIARSEELPPDAWFECWLKVRAGGLKDSPISEPLLRDILDYGVDCGLGQWRTGGHGRFVYQLEKLEERPAEIPEPTFDFTAARANA